MAQSGQMKAASGSDGSAKVTAVILCGGRATRMGGIDKGLVMLRGKTLAECCADRIAGQADDVVVSANRNLDAYRARFCRVYADTVKGFPGPLAGVLAVMQELDKDGLVVSLPCDGPFFPLDLVEKLKVGLQNDPAANCAAVMVDGKPEPGYALYRAGLGERLSAYLAGGGRKVRLFLEQNGVVWVPFPDINAFRNMNTLEEVSEAQTRSAG